MQHDGRGQIYWHQGGPGKKKVIQSDHVRVVGKYVTKPGDQPGQGEYCAQLRLDQVLVKGWTGPPDDGVHQLQQPHGALHVRGHELPQVGVREPLHDLVANRLPDHEEEGDGHVVVALVVVKSGPGHQHPHDQPGQLVLELRPVSLVYAGGEPFQTSVYV